MRHFREEEDAPSVIYTLGRLAWERLHSAASSRQTEGERRESISPRGRRGLGRLSNKEAGSCTARHEVEGGMKYGQCEQL